MKKHLILAVCMFCFIVMSAQVPQSFKYQGIARDSSGAQMVNRNINLRISIIDSTASGAMVYQEVHKSGTNQFGLYSVNIGEGIQRVGIFANIPWQTGNKWMSLELDPNAGSNFSLMGTSQLISVPYSLLSFMAVNVQNNDDADADPANEFITDVSFNSTTNVLTVTDGGNLWTTDLSTLANPNISAGSGISITGNVISNSGDLDNSNETNTAFSFNSATNELSITDAGNTFTVDLSSLAGGNTLTAGTGIDITGAIINNTGDIDDSDDYNITLNLNGTTLELTDNGGTKTADLSSLIDTDPDPTNELNLSIAFDSTTNVFTISDGGGSLSVNLNSLAASTTYTAGTGINIIGTTIANTGDLSDTNEYNTALNLDTNTNILTLTDAGNSLAVDFTSLVQASGDDDWTANGTHIYNTNTGSVGIGTMNPTAKLHVVGNNGFLATGTYGSGSIPATGAGVRLMWYPAKAAIRAGNVSGTNWDDSNIASWSVAMGNNTRASGPCSVAMGEAVIAQGAISTSFGQSNSALGDISTALGSNTNATGARSTSTGWSTLAAGSNSFAMGNLTIASGENSLAQGYRTTAAGKNSVALGNFMNTNNFEGTFMFGDNSITGAATPLAATANNQFIVRAVGGVKFFTNDSATIGAQLAPGANSWAVISDFRIKENFQPVDGGQVLDKISTFNLGTWNYIGQNPTAYRHYGPMAQDFFAAFGNDGIGTIGNDTTIATSDFMGVSFIAIQALEKRTTEQQTIIDILQSENILLKERLALIEKKLMISLN